MKKVLGKIKSAKITIDRGCFLCFWLHFDFGGSGQGFGGYSLCDWDEQKQRRVGIAAGADLIKRLMETFKVESFDKIEGKYVYALYEDDKWGSPIMGVQLTEPDGGNRFLISEWRNEWWPNIYPTEADPFHKSEEVDSGSTEENGRVAI